MSNIVLLDFGSQTTHLIKRRLNDMGVSVSILPGESAVSQIRSENPKALILSGGPASVYGQHALLPDKNIFSMGLPILGICYGIEAIGYLLGGIVEKGKKAEYGQTDFSLHVSDSLLFKGVPEKISVWMSHFDQLIKAPKGFKVVGSTSQVKNAAIENPKSKIYCTMFHPEVVHTEFGQQILKNFVGNIVGLTTVKPGSLQEKVNEKIEFIKTQTLGGKCLCAMSGGVDSSTVAVLAARAIGRKLHCVYVDTGLMREGETEQIETAFKKLGVPLKVVRAEKIFLNKLKGVVDPELKRKIIGNTFIEVFDKEALRQAQGKQIKYLLQGTIYPDVIESKGTTHSHKIKTHHNVGGLPEKMKLKVVEPFRELYKDEVREMATYLGLPDSMVWRQVFPGPGLAVRIIGEVTKEKLLTLRHADLIVREEIKKENIEKNIWMAFAIHTGIKTTGVVGDERIYGDTIALRILTSKDTMTADWARLPYDFLAGISSRITTEVRGVCRVVYDITTKPPSTMEWE